METPAYKNCLTGASKEQNTVVNLLKDSSFENGTAWSKSSVGTTARTSDKVYMGNYALKVSLGFSSTAVGAYGPVIVVPAGRTCTFSAYVQSEGASV